MTRRIFFLGLIVSLLSVLTATPAWAATLEFVAPTPGPGSTVTGTRTIQLKGTTENLLGLGLIAERIDKVTVTVRPRAGTGGSPQNFDATGDYSVSWTTNKLYNGSYDLEAVAQVSGGSSPTVRANPVTNVSVNNPPAIPSGLKVAQEEGGPALSWNANDEPDHTGYKVLRAVGEANATQLATVAAGTTKYKDATAPVDQPLTYRLIAVRKAAGGGSIDSAPSGAVSFTPVVASPSPSPTAEATPTPAPVAAGPAPAPTANSPLTPKFGAPTFKTLPRRDVGFEPILPYSAPIPESFESEPEDVGSSQASADLDEGITANLTQVDPARFVAAGLLMLVTSAHLARASRRLMRSGRTPRRPGGGAGPFSPLHA